MRYEWLDERVDEFIERYEAGQLLQDIADAFEVSTPTIQRRLHEHDVTMRNGGPNYVRLKNHVDELVDQYCNQQRSLQTIAEHYETSIKAVQFQLEKADVDCELTNPKTANIGFSRSKTRSYRGNYSEMDVSTDRTRGVSSNTQRRRKHTQFDL
jgi:Zn-dependent peptidase ImmA (M78 family)